MCLVGCNFERGTLGQTPATPLTDSLTDALRCSNIHIGACQDLRLQCAQDELAAEALPVLYVRNLPAVVCGDSPTLALGP